ncbi:unnamed protein product [Clavelina lepadiformis]|uniref:Uncharacterized protein n=1 Tax=Clavelina lepadiformis TaxID=159417 RepID=A0ABP0GLF3_CLALP
MSSHRGSGTKHTAKWFTRREQNKTNAGSSTLVPTESEACASRLSVGSKSEDTQGQRRQPAVQRTMKRRRTLRRTIKDLKINLSETTDENSLRQRVLTNEQKLRIYVLREILDTEEEYAKLLQFIVEVMIPDLDALAENDQVPSVNSDTVSKMLANIHDIHKLHATFITSLQKATHSYPYHTHCIGNIFIQHSEQFNVYGKFCSNFSNAQKISYSLEENPAVQNLIEKWKEGVAHKKRGFIHLEGFIISPVQRLCKYPLLLKQLKRFTPKDHDDFEPLLNAIKLMEGVTRSVNETERQAIVLQGIRDLEESFDSWEKSGKMSKHGFMVKRGGGPLKSWKIRWFTLSGYKLSYYEEPTKVKPLGTLDLTAYKALEETVTGIGRPYTFAITMPDCVHYMYTVNDEEKREWLTILKWKFNCIDRSRRQAHRPLETAIFTTLSSILNPKEQKTNFRVMNPVVEKEPKITDQTTEPQLKKTTSSSFFRSIRSRRSRRSRSAVLNTG